MVHDFEEIPVRGFRRIHRPIEARKTQIRYGPLHATSPVWSDQPSVKHQTKVKYIEVDSYSCDTTSILQCLHLISRGQLLSQAE